MEDGLLECPRLELRPAEAEWQSHQAYQDPMALGRSPRQRTWHTQGLAGNDSNVSVRGQPYRTVSFESNKKFPSQLADLPFDDL